MSRFLPTVVLVNVDTDLDADEVRRVAAALQKQAAQFASCWNIGATVTTADVHKPTADDIEIRLLKRPTMDGALGYHDELRNGTPIAYVFVELCQEYGLSWSSCASHELVELLADPHLRLCVQMDDGAIWDCEVADRVEADSYLIDGVEVSNWNTPDCFMPPADRSRARYDWLGLSTRPNEVRPGGYAQRYDSSGWTQVGHRRPYRKRLAELGMTRGDQRARRIA